MSIGSQKSANIKHFLGIDFGTAKVGLALADFETKIAFAYGTILNNRNFLEKLIEIIKKENVKKIIIGIPVYVNSEKVEYAGEKLGKLIEKKIPKIEIEYQNEMFTTRMAQDNLRAKGIKNIKRFDDQESAKIILQEWLDKT